MLLLLPSLLYSTDCNCKLSGCGRKYAMFCKAINQSMSTQLFNLHTLNTVTALLPMNCNLMFLLLTAFWSETHAEATVTLCLPRKMCCKPWDLHGV